MKQQIFPLELRGRFFLDKPKSKQPSSLIFMVRLKGKLYKFATNTKVYPKQWNQELQKAYISPILTNADNLNNSIVNKKIEEVKNHFIKFKLYLCNIDEYNTTDVIALLKNEFNDMARQKKKENAKIDDIIKTIQDAVYNDTTIKKGTSDNYIKKGLPALKFYLSYLEEVEKIKVNSFSFFTTEFFNAFAYYIHDNYTHDDGTSYSISSINSILKYAKSAVVLCARANKYLTEIEIASLKVKLFNDKSSPNHIALRDDEVMLLYNYQPTCKRDEEVRDVFLLECTLGHRITDILRLDERLEEIGGKYYVTISPKKTPNKKIEVGIIFAITKKILIDKYHCRLPNITKDVINKNIKRIAKEAGIQGEELQSFHYQGESEPKEIKRPRYECISTHTGRRTYISMLSARGWTYEQISKFTGQTTKMVEHYDKATSKYIGIYKDSLKNRPHEIVQLCEDLLQQNELYNPTVLHPANAETTEMNLDSLLHELFREQELSDLRKLHTNKVDILSMDKLHEIKKYLEDVSRTDRYKKEMLAAYNTHSKELKKRLTEILKNIVLLDPTHNTLRIAITSLQKMGINCLYTPDRLKYKGKAAYEAYILVVETPSGNIIIK